MVPTHKSPAPAPTAKPTSLRDLAEYLGLSRTTVSLVLNNSHAAHGISEETCERVRKAAVKLKYKANYFARMLNNKQSCMVGVLAPDLSGGYDSEILTGIERLLLERHYLYFVSSHHWDKALIRQRLEVFAERGAEGIILINTPVETESRLPMVSIGGVQHEFPLTRITLDNARGIRLALEYLYNAGHRDIAFFKGHTTSSDTEPRWAAINQFARSLNFRVRKEHVVQLKRLDHGLNPIREGYVAAEQLLRSDRPFTALLAFNDLSAIGAIHAFREAGKRIPDDISVVGFDDVQAASIIQPALTTIRQPLARMGMLAATEILARIEGAQPEPRNLLIEPELIIRQSTAPCPRHPRASRDQRRGDRPTLQPGM